MLYFSMHGCRACSRACSGTAMHGCGKLHALSYRSSPSGSLLSSPLKQFPPHSLPGSPARPAMTRSAKCAPAWAMARVAEPDPPLACGGREWGVNGATACWGGAGGAGPPPALTLACAAPPPRRPRIRAWNSVGNTCTRTIPCGGRSGWDSIAEERQSARRGVPQEKRDRFRRSHPELHAACLTLKSP